MTRDEQIARAEDVAWLHKFINCVPFGGHCPKADMDRAHQIVSNLVAALPKEEKPVDDSIDELVKWILNYYGWQPNSLSTEEQWLYRLAIHIHASPVVLPDAEEVREGGVMVPKEPTQELIDEWNYACRDQPGCAFWRPSYDAFLAAVKR